MTITPSTSPPSRRRLNRIERVRGEAELSNEGMRAFARSTRCAHDSTHRFEQIAALQWLCKDLLDTEHLRGHARGRKTGTKLPRDRDQRRARMRCLNLTQQLRARMFGHVDTGDHEILCATALHPARHGLTHAITCLAQPLLEQSAPEIILFVYHNA